jgi:3-hydroxyisobutyrate dehydrogenase
VSLRTPTPPTRVAFIGLGNMGGHMCRNLVTAGFAVSAYDLDADALARSAADGARPADGIADCARDAEILVTSLPGPSQVDAVLCGAGGAIASLAPGSLVVEMSTSSLEGGRRGGRPERADDRRVRGGTDRRRRGGHARDLRRWRGLGVRPRPAGA